jgi:hypothetical protein
MDWQVGDLAVCVEKGAWVCEDHSANTDGPDDGDVHEVTDVAGDGYLSFAPWPDHEFDGQNFRKILPDKHEQCEPEFVTLLKRSKVLASADTHPKDGDVKQAPLVSGAVPEGQTPQGGPHDQ